MRHLAFIVLLLMGKAAALSAQQVFSKNRDSVEVETVVFLINKSQVRGHLVEWERGSHLVLLTRDGLRLRFAESEVARMKMVRYGGPAREAAPREYAFRERGWYSATCLGVMLQNGGGGAANNYTFSSSIGYQMNRWGGVGIGIGHDQYGSNFELAFMPVFVDYRGYLLKKASTPYFNLMFGYGFARKLVGFSDGNPVDLTDGRFISPNIGFRIGASRLGNLTVDFGARLQSGSFTVIPTDPFGEGGWFADKFYHRYTLRLGVVF